MTTMNYLILKNTSQSVKHRFIDLFSLVPIDCKNRVIKFSVSYKTTNIMMRSGGFTLVETLVAISVLLMAVVAPMSLIAKNIADIFAVKDKIIALYLAEDAIDYVKYKIDTNFNAGDQNWLLGLDSCVGGSLCQVDSYNDTVVSYTGAVLKFDSSTVSTTGGIYGYTSGWQDSKFIRTITVTGLTPVANDPYPAQAPQEVIITTTVLWQDHGVPKQTTISEHAFAWGT